MSHTLSLPVISRTLLPVIFRRFLALTSRSFLSLFFLSFLTLAVSCHKSGGSSNLGSWTPVANFLGPSRSNAVSFVVGDSVAYVGLGYNASVQSNNGRLNDFYVFKPGVGWSQAALFPGTARSNAVAFTLGNYAYVGTGWDGASGIFNDFYQYNPATNQWTRMADFPGTARYDAVGFSLQGNGYIGTGFNGSTMNDFYQYNPLTNSWTSISNANGSPISPRRGASTFMYNNQAYIVSGYSNTNGGELAPDFWVFDPSQSPLSSWRRLRDIVNDGQGFDASYTDIAREYAVGFVNGSQGYLTTGINNTLSVSSTDKTTELVTSAWAYDFATDLWSHRTVYPQQARYGAVAFTINGKTYVGTGSDGGGGALSDVNQFVSINTP